LNCSNNAKSETKKQTVALLESKKAQSVLLCHSFGLNLCIKQNSAFVYLLTNKNHTVIYVGVTTDLRNRIIQHKTCRYKKAFTARYNVTELVYFEKFKRIVEAIKREKQLKAGSRIKKINLILETNPNWNDLNVE